MGKKLTLSVLTDRRVISPYGLHEGQNGQKGLNLLTRHSDQVIVNLGGKSSVNVEAGDIFTLKTPGGGGWGNPLPHRGSNSLFNFRFSAEELPVLSECHSEGGAI